MVFILIILAILLFIGSIAVDNSYNTYGVAGVLSIVGVTLLVVAALATPIIIVYFRSVLRVLNGIRRGILGHPTFELPGIKVFTVFMCIFVGFSVLNALIYGTLYSPMSDEMYYSAFSSLPYEFRYVFDSFVGDVGRNLALTSISMLVSNAGTVILIIILNRFNNRLNPNSQFTSF